jgi:aminopeptidase C
MILNEKINIKKYNIIRKESDFIDSLRKASFFVEAIMFDINIKIIPR